MAQVKIRPSWDRFREPQVTPEACLSTRRQVLKSLGFSGLGVLGLVGGCNWVVGGAGDEDHIPAFWVKKWADLLPAVRNQLFKVDRELTPERLVTSYNNFYEFSLVKEQVKQLVSEFQVDPWEVEIAGEVERKGKFDLDQLARIAPFEERIYRFRCVEAWSAVVPWIGYPLSRLIEYVKPDSSVRYVRFVTVLRPSQMPGQRQGGGYPWPYYEALTLEEAMNPLALLTFGLYGHPLNKQNGAPVRMVLPWKFGFKSIKSIVKIEFVRRQPSTFWDDSSREYGFYANISPRFDHPRWSQASEIFLNTRERIPTQLYNGYGEYVAHLYDENDRKYFF